MEVRDEDDPVHPACRYRWGHPSPQPTPKPAPRLATSSSSTCRAFPTPDGFCLECNQFCGGGSSNHWLVIGPIAHEVNLSRATVSRILRRAGMNRLRSLDPPPPVVRYEHKRPGDLIHFDIKRLARIVKPGHRIHGDRTQQTRGAGYEYLHITIDDHSRLAFGAILPDQKHASSILFFHMARAWYSVSVIATTLKEHRWRLNPTTVKS